LTVELAPIYAQDWSIYGSGSFAFELAPVLHQPKLAAGRETLQLELSGPRPLTEEQCHWLSELYAANFIGVFKVCCRILGSSDDAADAVHEVFLRAPDSLRSSAAPAQARAWLVAVARNHCLDMIRRRKRLETALTTLAAGPATSPEPERTVIDRQTVDAILDHLGVRERQALWQSAVERRSLDQIARSLGMTYMATAQLLHRSRKRAALLAAKLAAILGLVHLRRQVERAVLIGFVLPIALALPATSSPTHPSQPTATPHSISRPAHSSVPPRRAIYEAPARLAPSQPALSLTVPGSVSLRTPAVPAPPAGTSQLNSLVKRIEQTVDSLVSIAVSSPYLNGH
jgi:RNA polymerase sigma-70 factor, ECF subfamily